MSVTSDTTFEGEFSISEETLVATRCRLFLLDPSVEHTEKAHDYRLVSKRFRSDKVFKLHLLTSEQYKNNYDLVAPNSILPLGLKPKEQVSEARLAFEKLNGLAASLKMAAPPRRKRASRSISTA